MEPTAPTCSVSCSCQLLKCFNRKRGGAGRDLWRPSSPTPLQKQVYLAQGTQDHPHVTFECLQGRKLHNPAQSPPVLCHPHSKEVFSSYSDEIYCMSVPGFVCSVDAIEVQRALLGKCKFEGLKREQDASEPKMFAIPLSMLFIKI